MANLLTLQGIEKAYGSEIRTPVLKGIDLILIKGEMATLIGQSGSGKTTLLNLIGVLDRPDRGTALFEGQNLYSLSDRDLSHFRNSHLGFVFQYHHLLPEFTALENVLLPVRILTGRITPESSRRAKELLERVGVSERMNNKATQLSGGQQQRVAIARALINQPDLILADEPTGNLDTDSGSSVLKLLREINREFATTFLIVTHDRHIAASSDRVIELADGRVTGEFMPSTGHPDEGWNRLAPCYCRLRKDRSS